MGKRFDGGSPLRRYTKINWAHKSIGCRWYIYYVLCSIILKNIGTHDVIYTWGNRRGKKKLKIEIN